MYPNHYYSAYQQQMQQQQYNFHPSHLKKMQRQCRKFLQNHVNVLLMDGNSYDGFIEFVDQQNVYLAIPYVEANQEETTEDRNNNERTYPYYGYSAPVSSYSIQRVILPLAGIGGVSAVPYY
ncbi:hypothetical protein WD019_00355 [Fictibacillus sp. Mic-4]|uniref:hypothetical protein n=1 Tax=Fictibacillus TaxID=1329200 RepID=UPI0003F96146|nr:hypothetical protein [Fictibacillus gelatini]